MCRLSNLLSNTDKRDLIAAFHGSGTREQRDPRDLRGTRHPPPSPLSRSHIRLSWIRVLDSN
ncbi:hypothetical protein EMIT0P2_110092 [Pseudomonas sp. IT-P2]